MRNLVILTALLLTATLARAQAFGEEVAPGVFMSAVSTALPQESPTPTPVPTASPTSQPPACGPEGLPADPTKACTLVINPLQAINQRLAAEEQKTQAILNWIQAQQAAVQKVAPKK